MLKEKGSRFYAYAYPIESETEVKPILDKLRMHYRGAVHFCYAWQLGTDHVSYRANDDGEPAHTAGSPIYGQIQSFGLTNVLVVIVRFFGGVKLGVGGLISAYRTSAQLALENGEIIKKEIRTMFTITIDYPNLNKVMRVIREFRAEITAQQMQMDCEITACISRARESEFKNALLLVQGARVRQ